MKNTSSLTGAGPVSDRDETLLESGEVLLGVGSGIMAFAVASTHFVMGVFLALPIAILALIVLITGVGRAKGTDISGWVMAAGILLLVAALAAAIVVGFKACSLSYAAAYHSVRPSAIALPGFGAWLQNSLTWLIPAGLMAAGLSLWTDWSRSRRRRWCIIAFIFSPLVILAHQILAALGGPRSA